MIFAAPRTKKTHSRIVMAGNRPRLLPSATFAAWNRIAQLQLAKFRASTFVQLPLTEPVTVAAMFYRDKNTGDLVNYMQALADALQEGGIVKNDSQIRIWDGSRLLVDKDNPRVEVWIREILE